MKITCESELMKNQKHADVMAPDLAFEALQTPEGNALFFSIGTDHVLYVTRELPSSQTGWNRLDLSTVLSAPNGGQKISAKSFALSQNAQTLAFDITLVVNIGNGPDALYVSLNHANTSADWAKGVPWTLVPFDATGIQAPSPLTIADVYLMNIPCTDGSGSPPVENLMVDIMRAPGTSSKLLDRYYITPGVSPRWNRHALPADIDAGSIYSCLGYRTDDYVPGIYTFGTIGVEKEAQLIFVPQFNAFNPRVPPNSARLTLPAAATAISSALDSTGTTNLFVAATAGLYVFTPDNQHDGATPTLIVQPPNIDNNANGFAGTSALAASTIGLRTVVWALNAQGNLLYVSCLAGSEATPSAWSTPITIVSGVEGFAFYLNTNAANNILFAHLSGQLLVQLTQDPMTGNWVQRSITLPATKIDDMLEYNSYTSHITITDDNTVAQPNIAMTITSTSPVTVYVNGIYHVLTHNVPINVTSDATGTVTAVQETQDLTAVHFKVTIPGNPPIVFDVDPLSNAMQKLSQVQSRDDLEKIQIKNSDGTSRSLVPDTVLAGDKTAAADSIKQLIQIKGTLPADGSVPTTSPAITVAASRLSSTASSLHPLPAWGVSFSEDGFKYHEGDDAIQNLGIRARVNTASIKATASSEADPIMIAAGDLFHYLKKEWSSVDKVLIEKASDLYHFVCHIAGEVYEAVLNCVSAVAGAIEFVFNKIKVAFEDLIAWIGFLFEWDDIITTHNVVKNIMKQYAKKAIDSLDTLEATIDNTFISIEDHVNAWAGVTDPGETIGTQQQGSSNATGNNSPQNHWALHHMKNGISIAQTDYVAPDNGSSVLDGLISDLEGLVENEKDYILTTVAQIKEQVIDQFATLTPVEIMKRIMGIAADLLLKTARNILVKVADIVKIMAKGVFTMLDAPINIPILSSMYNDITGNQLSFLDLVCLIGAIPATIMYKLLREAGEAPFPKGPATDALIQAPDFASIVKLLSPTAQLKAAPRSHAVAETTAVAKTHSSGTTNGAVMKATAVNLSPGDAVTVVLNFTAFFASLAVDVCIFAKLLWSIGTKMVDPDNQEPIPVALGAVASVSYVLYCGSDFPGLWNKPDLWTNILNDCITGFSISKTFADNLGCGTRSKIWIDIGSPVTEFLTNFIWLSPAIGGLWANPPAKPSDWIGFAANMVFDVGGMTTIGTASFASLEVQDATPLVMAIFSLGYGATCLAYGSTLLAGK
jgi:hypothetical protein